MNQTNDVPNAGTFVPAKGDLGDTLIDRRILTKLEFRRPPLPSSPIPQHFLFRHSTQTWSHFPPSTNVKFKVF